MSCSKTQRSDTGEARTRNPSVSSQALYHCATELPFIVALYLNALQTSFDHGSKHYEQYSVCNIGSKVHQQMREQTTFVVSGGKKVK